VHDRIVAPGIGQKHPVHALILRACKGLAREFGLLVSRVGPEGGAIDSPRPLGAVGP
jgi:hypothetical protein